MKQLILVGMLVTAFGAQALTVGKLCRAANGAVMADLAFDAAGTDRSVVVAWGASDAGADSAAWSRAEFAQGEAVAGATACRVTVPDEVASAAAARFFLVPASAQPSYLRASGKQFILTDFYPTPTSAIVADYQWENTTSLQQRIFGCNGDLCVHHYINGSGGLSWSYSNSGNWTAFNNTTFKADKARTVITLDAKNNKVTLTKAGTNAYDKAMKTINSSSPGTRNASVPLGIFSYRPATADPLASARLYSLTCSTNGVLARNFVPWRSGGRAGLRDSVTGTFYLSVNGVPFWAGAPTSVAASDTSAAVAAASELAKLTVSSASANVVVLSFGASAAAREIWCAWDETDQGDTFGAWAHNEYVATPAASATTARCLLPPGAQEAKCVRFFLLAGGGTYPCTYIRGDGRQAIDTGIKAGTNLAISVEVLPRCLSIYQQRAFGLSSVTNEFVLTAYINGSGKWAWSAQDHVGNWTGSTVVSESKRTTISLDVPNNLYSLAVEGTTVYTATLSSVVPAANRTLSEGKYTVPILCGKNASGVYNQPMQGELYGATLKRNGTAVRTLTPRVVDGVAGLQDAVSGTFFGNAITNGYTQFVPGGRTDAPTALAAAETVRLADVKTGDVFADAKIWLRGMAVDDDGDGTLAKGEIRDALRRTTFTDTVSSAKGYEPRYTNDLIRMPGRGVSRAMQSIYLPQTVVITNAEDGTGYANPSTIGMSGPLKGLGNRWSFIIRAKADMATAPTYGSQWLVKFGHNGKQGVMVGFSGSAKTYRKFSAYSTGQGLGDCGLTATNGWFDLAVVADGQRLTFALMSDGNELNGTGGDQKVAYASWSQILEPKHNLVPMDSLTIGAEESRAAACRYPMTTNDNGIKSFRGWIQQFAVWDRPLTEAEIFAAFGWPRQDLWRMGVADGSAEEFDGEPPADGVAVDDAYWPIEGGVAASRPLTFRFPIDGQLENLCGQLFRWKSLAGTGDGRLELTLNGKKLGQKMVRAGTWSQWYVPAAALVAGTNTATLARVDGETGRLIPDVVALGGGVQVGKANKGYGEFVQEGTGRKHLYAADGNLHDVRRVLYCGRSANSNFYYHVSLPAEMVHSRQRWRFTLGTAGSNFGTALKSHPVSIDLNGKCLGTYEMVNYTAYSFDVEPEDVVVGENVFNLRNGAPNTGTHYLGIDYFTLEPLKPDEGTIMLLR